MIDQEPLTTDYDDELDYIHPKKQPLVSVIIPAYNSGKYINRCIDSLIVQTYQNWEAIVIVAPSIDNTLDQLIMYHDGRIIIYGEGKKSNCATARNTGFDICRGKYITFLDSDDYFLQDRLQKQIAFMEANPDLDWCWSHLKVISDIYEPVKIHKTSPLSIIDGMQGVQTSLFKKSYLIGIAKNDGYLFDPNMSQVDDGDLMMRVRHGNYAELPQVLTVYVGNPEGLTRSTSRLKIQWYIWRVVLKNHAWEFVPYMIKDTVIMAIDLIFDIDLVAWNKKREIER